MNGEGCLYCQISRLSISGETSKKTGPGVAFLETAFTAKMHIPHCSRQFSGDFQQSPTSFGAYCRSRGRSVRPGKNTQLSRLVRRLHLVATRGSPGTTNQSTTCHAASFHRERVPTFTDQSAKKPLNTNLAWAPACPGWGMDKYELQAHRCEHSFRTPYDHPSIFSGSATRLQKDVSSRHPVCFTYTYKKIGSLPMPMQRKHIRERPEYSHACHQPRSPPH